MFEIDKGVGRPEFRPQLLGGNELAGRPQQHSQHLQGTALDRQTDSGTAQFSGLEVQLEGGKAHPLIRILFAHF
jgi:hypothetical protein